MKISGKKFKVACFVLILLVGFQATYHGAYTLAMTFTDSQNVVMLEIDYDTAPTVEPIFKSGANLWYPGFEAEGILTIHNKLTNEMSIGKMGMTIELYKDGKLMEGATDEESAIIDEYMEMMKIDVGYNDFISKVFSKKFYEGTFQGFCAEGYTGKPVVVKGGGVVDLIYTVSMDEAASANIAGIEAKIDFTFQVDEQSLSAKVQSGVEVSGIAKGPSINVLSWFSNIRVGKVGGTIGNLKL